MYCPKCGNEVGPGQQFCSRCGAPQTPPPQSQTPPPPPSGGFQQPPGGSLENNKLILSVFAAICAAVYGLRTLGLVFSLFHSSITRLSYGIFFRFDNLIFLVLSAVGILLGIWMCLMLLLTGFRRDSANSDGLLVLLAAGGVLLTAVRVLRFLFSILFFWPNFSSFAGVFSTVAGAVISVGGVYLIQRYLLNEYPLAGKDVNQLLEEGRLTLASLGSILSGPEGQQSDPPPQSQPPQWNRPQPPRPQPGPVPGGGAPFRLKTDRSLLLFILLNLVTCGLYSCYFIYSLARDLNVACDGDGRNTAGLLKFILLSFITCGIYSLFWHYSVGNRLAANAPRYGMSFQENGTTILLWVLIGSLLCGLGSLVAVHIIIKNSNMICGAYNHYHGM